MTHTRSIAMLFAWTALALSLPLAAQEFRLTLEEPVAGATATGVSNIRGWAIASAGIDRVEIFIDGQYAFDVPYGGQRVDVGNAFPNIIGADESGFGLTFNYGVIGAGEHTLTARAIALDGSTREQSAAFEVVAFPSAFLAAAERPSLAGVDIGIDADDGTIEVKGLQQGGNDYDVDLAWSTASQSFVIVDLEARELPASCSRELPKRAIPNGIVFAKGFSTNVAAASDRIQAGSGFSFSLFNASGSTVTVEQLVVEDDEQVLTRATGAELPSLNSGRLSAQRALNLTYTVPDAGAVGEIETEFVLSIGGKCFALGDELFDVSNDTALAGYTATASGLQYAAVEAGSGPSPSAAASVRVDYIGSLEDGTIFDSSYARGEPAVFGVSQVIDGFAEGLRLMNEGATFKLRIPPELGYGAQAVGAIPANSTLLFEVTLVEIL